MLVFVIDMQRVFWQVGTKLLTQLQEFIPTYRTGIDLNKINSKRFRLMHAANIS